MNSNRAGVLLPIFCFHLSLEIWPYKFSNYLNTYVLIFYKPIFCATFCVEMIFKAVNSVPVFAEFLPTALSGLLNNIGIAGILFCLHVFF